MQPENLLPFSYEPITGPYSERDEFGSHLHTLLTYVRNKPKVNKPDEAVLNEKDANIMHM
jgi:hypothetical protein